MRRYKFNYMLHECETAQRSELKTVARLAESEETRGRRESCARAVGMIFDALLGETLRVGGVCIKFAQDMVVQAVRTGWSPDEIAHAVVTFCSKVADEDRPIYVVRRAGTGKTAGRALRCERCTLNQRFLLIKTGDFRLYRTRQRYEVALLIADLALVCLEELIADKPASDNVPKVGLGLSPRSGKRLSTLSGKIRTQHKRKETGTLRPD
ncbi:hypothetical protein [Brucella intermedia]|uniref:hypothetical protein n=1 Tax=Brucella intermedia TaxID=94625 RepID=UPI00046A9D95|nr:hypothetical protein [Brucella intermedia]